MNIHLLATALQGLADSSQEVLNHWEKGDLAGAVSDMDPWITYAREVLSGQAIPELPPHDPDRCRTTDGFEDPAMTNGMRAEEAFRTLRNAQEIARDEDDFCDFLCHLLHLAHEQGHDPLEMNQRAMTHFLAEAGPLPA